MSFRIWHLRKAVFVVVAVAVLGWLVMALWNFVMPGLYAGLHPIDYQHAFGLLVLSRILFGGFRGRGGWQGRRQWERWQAMTPEEREQFQQKMTRRCWPRGPRGTQT